MVSVVVEILLTTFSTLAWGGLWLKNQREQPGAELAEAERHRRYLTALLGGCALAGYGLIWLPRLCGF